MLLWLLVKAVRSHADSGFASCAKAGRASRDSAITVGLFIFISLYIIVRSMKRLKPVDVVIAGGGWTGLLMAKEITHRTALSVVVLERGPARKTADYATGMDELDYAVRLRMMQNL